MCVCAKATAMATTTATTTTTAARTSVARSWGVRHVWDAERASRPDIKKLYCTRMCLWVQCAPAASHTHTHIFIPGVCLPASTLVLDLEKLKLRIQRANATAAKAHTKAK